ncbi:MAG: glycosyl transferase group 1 [Myxococcales bacterium]|nr:glycosyl transferase group 1 [Myxococcales bacterium]
MRRSTADGPHKVLLFIPHLQQGGAERQILELMRRLPPHYAPSLCLYRANDEARTHYASYLPPGEPRHALDVDDMGPVGLARLVKLLRKERPAILHSYRDKANLWARLAALMAPVPVVLTSVRNRYQGPLYGAAEFLLQTTSDRVLTNSRGIEEELVNWSRVRPDRIQIINNFVDLEQFRPPTADERARARAHHGFADGEIVLILPGRLAMQKHQLGLGLALSMLRHRGKLASNVRLVLAGRRRDKIYSRIVPVGMRMLGLGEHITYLEPVKDMLTLYHAADALVMPSLFEGMPNAVLEAHACGLPCVVSHAANRDGIVLDEQSGFEVPTLDPAALAAAIEKVIGASEDQRRAMGVRGRANVAHRFHPDRILEETVALYDDLIAEKGLA